MANQMWNNPGIPHKDWTCIDVIDLKEDGNSEYEKCEMCGNENVRFIHVMKHADVPYSLRVGCVCAEKMSDDYVNPRKYESALRNKAKRKAYFNSIPWKYNPIKKTYSKKYKDTYITILYSKYGNYGIFFQGSKIWKHNGRNIKSFELAESVAFEEFEELNDVYY